MLAARRGAAEAEAESSAVAAEVSRLRSVETKVKDAVANEERETAKADAIRSLLDKRALATVRIMAIRSALGNEMWIEKWEGDRVTVRGWSDDLKTLVSRTKTGGSTAAQIIEARLKASPVVSSVKIESMTDVGKDAALKQIVVVVKILEVLGVFRNQEIIYRICYSSNKCYGSYNRKNDNQRIGLLLFFLGI